MSESQRTTARLEYNGNSIPRINIDGKWYSDSIAIYRCLNTPESFDDVMDKCNPAELIIISKSSIIQGVPSGKYISDMELCHLIYHMCSASEFKAWFFSIMFCEISADGRNCFTYVARGNLKRNFKIALALANSTIEQFAKSIGVTGAAVHHVLNGKPGKELSTEIDQFISIQFNVLFSKVLS